MRAARYRLRFFTGATLTGATYGGGAYGDQTYGTLASDALTTAHHRLVPWPAGARTMPSWQYREGDTSPDWEAQIIADDGVVDYTGLDRAILAMTPINEPDVDMEFPLTVETAPNGDQRLVHKWLPGELNQVGSFRCVVVLLYSSGRWMTVTPDDRHGLVVTPMGA